MLPGNELRLHTTRLVKTTDGLRGYLRVSELQCACSSLRWPRRPWPISEGILNRLLRRGRGIGAGCCDELQSRQRGARESSLEDVQALIRESIVV